MMVATQRPERTPHDAVVAENESFASVVPARSAIIPSTEEGESILQLVITIFQVMFSIVASALFILGIVGKSDLVTDSQGWDEVFVVTGSLFVFPILSILHENFLKYFPISVSKSLETNLWFYGLRLALIGVYGTQQGLFMTYLVIYSGPLCWIFLIPDVAVLLMMVLLSTRWTSLAVNFYILVLAVKFAIFWPNLDQSDAANNEFATSKFGPNGLLALLMLTVPIIQFPVLISRLSSGMSITQAYTVNMAAVFAHLLHFLDVLEMYQLGLQRSTFASDVQSLILIFVLMGLVTSNLYYVSLFFNDDTIERMLQKLQPAEQELDALGGGTNTNTTTDDTLLHYFVWVLFFIDLPFATLRFVTFIVHNTRISTFFAKNLMMMASVILMLIQHGKQR